MSNIKILCIHGIGGKDAQMNDSTGWVKDWRNAFIAMTFANSENVAFMKFDSFFSKVDADLSDYWDFFQITFRDKMQEKGLKDWFDNFPDMVVEFLLDKESIRKKLRNELKEKIQEENPNVIFAHSLGSMMCYDFFTQPENSHYNHITLVTAGSQLGHPKLRNHRLKQPIEMLPVKFWYNLNNSNDKVFARHPILLSSGNYKEVKTEFRDSSVHHDGLGYLNNANAIKDVWNQIKNRY